MASSAGMAVDVAWDAVDAVLLDLDGVITPTAEVHMHAWAEMFTPFLAEHDVAPYTEQDYFAYVDGRPRYDGVATLLDARGIDLPWGDPSDSPDTETVCGVQAGAAGGFALVVGVDRGAGAEKLRENGADIVVQDLAELVPAVLEVAR